MVMDLLENMSTKQKVVDYIRLKRKNCDAETAESDKTGCLNSLVVEARQELAARISQMQGKRDAATVAAIKQSQVNWEMYRDSACASLATEEKRLECELTLTRSRTHDLGSIY